MPGETSWEIADHFLTPLITDKGQGPVHRRIKNGVISVLTNYTVYYQLPGIDQQGITFYFLRDNLIILVNVLSKGTEYAYSMKQILTKYGKQSQVYISAFTAAPDTYIPFTTALYYQAGILAVYEWMQEGLLAIKCKDVLVVRDRDYGCGIQQKA